MSRRRSPFLLGLVGLFVLSSAPPAPAAPEGIPRLELRAAASRLEIPRYGPGPVWLDLGVSLAALDAPFELQVRRDTYDDPIRVWQAFHRPGGIQVAELPSDILEDWIGLDRFLRIDLYQEGTLVRSRLTDACPGGYQSERVDGSGPFDPTYPAGCGFNPLTLGGVWGSTRGGAASHCSGTPTSACPTVATSRRCPSRPATDALRYRPGRCRRTDRDPDPQAVRLRFLRRSRRA